MYFEGRELKPYAEPVTAEELKELAVYFAVHFADQGLLVPELEPLVFIGRDLLPGDADVLYFQDVGSYQDGVRFQSRDTKDAVFYAQGVGEIKYIFEYERALDVLLACSLRRRERERTA